MCVLVIDCPPVFSHTKLNKLTLLIITSSKNMIFLSVFTPPSTGFNYQKDLVVRFEECVFSHSLSRMYHNCHTHQHWTTLERVCCVFLCVLCLVRLNCCDIWCTHTHTHSSVRNEWDTRACSTKECMLVSVCVCRVERAHVVGVQHEYSIMMMCLVARAWTAIFACVSVCVSGCKRRVYIIYALTYKYIWVSVVFVID